MMWVTGCQALRADLLNCPRGPPAASVGRFGKFRYATRMQLDRRSSAFEHSGLDEEGGDGGNADHRDAHGHSVPARDPARVAAGAHDALFKGPGGLNGGVSTTDEDESADTSAAPVTHTTDGITQHVVAHKGGIKPLCARGVV